MQFPTLFGRALTVAALLALAFPSLAAAQATAPTTAVIQGTVSSDGAPVAGAKVALSGPTSASTTTPTRTARSASPCRPACIAST